MDLQEKKKRYLDLVYRYLAIRNRSEKEIRDYLVKKKADESLISEIVSLLKEQKFLNDVEFARSWIVSRARYRPKGKNALQFELLQKGISKKIIDAVLQEVHEDLPDQLEQAKRLIAKRVEKLSGHPRQEIYNKVGSFLARRGFDWDTIKKAIDQSLA